MIQNHKQFVKEFQQFMRTYYPDDLDQLTNLKSLFRSYNEVQKQRGFILYFSKYPTPPLFKDIQILQIFQQYLLSFEYFQKSSKFVSYNGTFLQKAHYLQNSQEISDVLQKHQISVLNMSDQLKLINQDLFTFKDLLKNHPNKNIDIRIQIPQQNTFKSTKFNNLAFPHQWTISNYIKYLQNPKKYYKNSSNSLLFAVNIDMNDMPQEMQRLKSLIPHDLTWSTQKDALSYLRQNILGVNIPQMYLKIKGVYTGGHQENLSVTAINLNHGPGKCLWITVDETYVAQFRKQVLKDYKFDILKQEGLWFKDPEYLIEKNIPVKYTIQEAGDLILLGPGCLHWVKALDDTINSAWNIVCKNQQNYESMIKRHKINQEINYHTVIPIKNLFLDLLLHEKQTKIRLYLRRKVKEFFDEEQKDLKAKKSILKDIGQDFQVKVNQNAHLVLLCRECRREIFIYFSYIEVLLCLDCTIQQMIEIRNDDRQDLIIEAKVSSENIQEIIDLQKQQCMRSVCYNDYQGETVCRFNQKKGQDEKVISKQHKKGRLKKAYVQLTEIEDEQKVQVRKNRRTFHTQDEPVSYKFQ